MSPARPKQSFAVGYLQCVVVVVGRRPPSSLLRKREQNICKFTYVTSLNSWNSIDSSQVVHVYFLVVSKQNCCFFKSSGFDLMNSPEV